MKATTRGANVSTFNGVVATNGSNVVARDSVASGNSDVGIFATGAAAQLDVENSLVTHNVAGLLATGGAGMRVSQTTIEDNTTGLSGSIASFGNNRLAGNTTNGSFTSTIPLQ